MSSGAGRIEKLPFQRVRDTTELLNCDKQSYMEGNEVLMTLKRCQRLWNEPGALGGCESKREEIPACSQMERDSKVVRTQFVPRSVLCF